MAKSKSSSSSKRQSKPKLSEKPSKAAAEGVHDGNYTHTGSKQEVPPLRAGLYVVATPIGNAADISLRALDVLAHADRVICEDTRVTGKLLKMHGIAAHLTAYHDHNAARVRPQLIDEMRAGKSIAQVSDAGTPSVSDPGYKLVRACIDAEIYVTAIPGPTAGVTGLILSGLPTDRFLFAGFPPAKTAGRRNEFETLKSVPATLVFQESAKRLAASLADMETVFGPREAAVARELTKLHEEVRRGPLDELTRHYQEAGAPRGEVVVIVAPPSQEEPDESDIDEMIRARLAEMSVRDAAAEVAAATGLPRRRIYTRALAIADEQGTG